MTFDCRLTDLPGQNIKDSKIVASLSAACPKLTTVPQLITYIDVDTDSRSALPVPLPVSSADVHLIVDKDVVDEDISDDNVNFFDFKSHIITCSDIN